MEPQFKMKDIVQKTGVSKSTVQYYISLGLLPDPVKKSKNMAYYPALYLEIVPAIRYLQENMRLPLGTIKQIIDAIGYDKVSIENAAHYYETFLSPLGYGDNAVIYTREELLEHSGLDGNDLRELESGGLLFPSADGTYSHAGAAAAVAYKKLKDQGFSYPDITGLTSTAKRITHEVHALYHKKAKGLAKTEEQELTRLMSTELRIIINYLIDQYILSIYNEEIK